MQSEFLTDSSITTSLFNASTELFSDPIDEVKAEYSSDFHSFGNYPQPNHFETQPPTQDDDDEEPQLHTLQTPQQLLEEQKQKQQQLQQQQQQYQQYPTASSTAPPPDTTTATNTQQHSEQLLQTGYDHSNTYANQNHYAATSTPAPTTATNNQYAGSNNKINNNSASGTAAPMQPPTSGLGRGAPGQPRRRRTSHANNVLVAAQAGAESLESMYLNEVRKKNILLAEQLEIARKRMQLEERKVNLLERFFPQCLEMQEQILGKLNSNT